MKAHDILEAAAGHMQDRAKTYDAAGDGERSMSRTVAMFNALTPSEITVEEGWLFMACLKMVRSQQGNLKMDNYEDGAAYFALAGEEAARTRGAAHIDDESLAEAAHKYMNGQLSIEQVEAIARRKEAP